MSITTPDTDTEVPEDDQQPLLCPYCRRPFAREDLVALHAGLEHYEALTPLEREAYVDAYEAEETAIRKFRLKAIGALITVYFLFLFAYLVFT